MPMRSMRLRAPRAMTIDCGKSCDGDDQNEPASPSIVLRADVANIASPVRETTVAPLEMSRRLDCSQMMSVGTLSEWCDRAAGFDGGREQLAMRSNARKAR